MKKRTLNLLTILFLIIISIGITNVNAMTNKPVAKAEDKIEINEDINASTFLAGKNIKLRSIIKGIGFIAGEKIDLDGTLDYGLILGEEININGTIENDAFILGEEININGTINKDLYVAGLSVTIRGTVTRDIYICAEEIDIEDTAVILGNIHYNDDIEIEGKTANINKTPYKMIALDKQEQAKEQLKNEILNFLRLSVILVALILICPKLFKKITKLQKNQKFPFYLQLVGYGFVILIGIPVIILILLISNIGTKLGLILLLIYIIMIMLSNILSSYIIGNLITKKLFKNDNIYLTGLSGLILVQIINLIPVLSIFTLTLGLGTFKELLTTTNKVTQ